MEGGRTQRRAKRMLRVDLTVLAVIGVLLVGALGATVSVLYQQLYSPTAFVVRYLDLLAQGRAADALTVPGVAVDSIELDESDLPTTASEALLRADALAPLTDIVPVSSQAHDGVTSVTVAYQAGPHEGTTTFEVESAGWAGVTPVWRFAQSPLAVIELTVRGSMQFSVNGFAIDKRQVSPSGVDADPLESTPLLVFSPGFYSITVATAAVESDGIAVLSDAPQADIPIDLQTEPSDEFVAVVQQKVDDFLAQCATQTVLQPTGCPFGYYVQNRIVGDPVWSITSTAPVALAPDGAGWSIRRTQGVAHIDVDVRSLFDGSITHVSEDVPFFLTGSIAMLPDGTASIQVTPTD